MKKYKLLGLAMIVCIIALAQPVQKARNYVNATLVPNGSGAITASKLNVAFAKTLDAIDSLSLNSSLKITGGAITSLPQIGATVPANITPDSLFKYQYQATNTGAIVSNGIMYNATRRTGSDSDVVVKKDVYQVTDIITSNGSSTMTTSQPYLAGSLNIKELGVEKDPTEYSETSSTTFTLQFSPFVGNRFIIKYKKQ